jgi:hypothetical protein
MHCEPGGFGVEHTKVVGFLQINPVLVVDGGIVVHSLVVGSIQYIGDDTNGSIT